jgi:hypothetical protein
MRTRIYGFLITIFSISFCYQTYAQVSGYTDIKELHNDFVKVLKTENWDSVEIFLNKIMPDKHMIEWMSEKGLVYRDFPNIVIERPIRLDYYRIEYTYRFYLIKKRVYSNRMIPYVGNFTYWDDDIKITEMYGTDFCEPILEIKSDDDSMYIKLGEFIRIDGIWKVITIPK